MKTYNLKNLRVLVLPFMIFVLCLAGISTNAQESKQTREVIPGYTGWAENPDSLNVYIDDTWTEAEKDSVRAGINRWNNAGCVPKFKEVSNSADANVTITQGDPGEGNAGLASWHKNEEGKITDATITIAEDTSPLSIKEVVTHELGHVIGLADTDEAANGSDAMKGSGPTNGSDGNLSQHDSTEMRQAAASITEIGEDALPEEKAISPEKAIFPGQFTDLLFNLPGFYPPETAMTVTPFEDPQLFLEYAFLEGNQLWVGAFTDLLHPSGKVLMDITINTPFEEPYNFRGYYYVNMNPVPQVDFQCPFDVVQFGDHAMVNWINYHSYPFSNPLRALLVMDGNTYFNVRPNNDFFIPVEPGYHYFELRVDDYQVNSANYTRDVIIGNITPPWEDGFESYPVGAEIVGENGWEFWFGGQASPSARITDTQVHTGQNALQILGKPDLTGDDVVHQFSGCNSGAWNLTLWQFIPEQVSVGTTYITLLNDYGLTVEDCNWSTQLAFNTENNTVESQYEEAILPLVRGEWVKIEVILDFDNDSQTINYNDQFLFSKSWTEGILPAGVPDFAALDLFSGDVTEFVYYDDISLMPHTPPIAGGMLKVGDWLKSEDWHRWIGNDKQQTKVEFYPDQNEGIVYVEFYFSIAGTGEWILFGSDENGQSAMAPGPLPTGSGEPDGWSSYLDHSLLPAQNAELEFKARMFTVDSFFDVFTEIPVGWDVTPPSAVTTNLYDYYLTTDPYILLEVLPEGADIAYLEIETEPKLPYFEKGVPPAYQPGDMDCGPTALAACLKYFESHGYPNICGGLSLAELIEQLKDYCETDPENGTWDNKLESGALRWINEHGDGMTVRRTRFNWKEMRNELERGQDVITLFQWEDATGLHGHFMTFNSVSNVPEPDGRVKIDFMDPWTGEIIDGYINPQTGEVGGFTDSQGNVFPPDGSWVFSNVIICPAETSVSPGTGTIVPWPIPTPYPIPLDPPGLHWIRIQIIDQDGNKSRLDYPVEVVAQSYPEDMFLKIGDWLVAETWHDWIGGMNNETPVELLASDPDHIIQQVGFNYSIDGGQTFTQFCTDTDGSQPALNTIGEAGDGDGWSCIFPHDILPPLDLVLLFRAEVTLINGDVLNVDNEIVFDPTPPNEAIINLEDWLIFEGDEILLEVDPGNCLDLNSIWVDLVPKVDSFAKGIPPISQRIHSDTHCSPTAAAACLKYFESQGDNNICGGLSDSALVAALANIMKTNQGKSGTYISDIANGLANWANSHGNNYTVRKLDYNWNTMRNELERCQDVISSIFWPNGGGHSMTFNSIVNEPNANGTITVDFMDPWTGKIEWGQINPATGMVTGFSGAGTSGEMGTMVIVCPKESGPLPDDGQIIPGPFPRPGIIIPVPDPGLYFLRIIFMDNSMHIARTDLVLKREPAIDLDFGDAPDDPYPTLLASNGARHIFDGVTFLGNKIDVEPDGQPNNPATGDDISNVADEDGVIFRTPLVQGNVATIKVLASVDGVLNVWLDIDRNNTWADAIDHVFTDLNLTAGWNTLTLNVPATAAVGITYMRFRFDSQGGLNYYGPAENGEVEDYMVRILPEGWGHFITPSNHTILVPLNISLLGTSLSANDALGVFYTDDNDEMVCGGAQIWDGVNNQVVLAYGDDNTTIPKDGFDAGEALTWKLYHTAIGTEEYVTVSYDMTMPQSDGKFIPYGLSGLTAIYGLSVTATATPTTLCEGGVVQLDAVVTGGSGNPTYSWSSIPSGFTSNIKNPTDTPTQDITYLVVVTDGGASATSSVDVDVQLMPVADAGPDETICETDVVALAAAWASNYSAIAWVTSGDGAFNDPTLLNPTYVPGPTDISLGSVDLSISVDPILPCVIYTIDMMTLTIVNQTTADAGNDATICPGNTFTLAGAATNHSSVLWSTGGDGVFDDATILGATYTPGAIDIQLGMVTLCLEAYPISPCTVGAADCMILYIREEQTVYLFEGWNGLSSYLTPFNSSDNYDLFSPILNNLVVAYNFDGAFWPGNTNTLHWVDSSGYIVKLTVDDEMIFCGHEISDKVLNLEQNWNLIPVLSTSSVLVDNVFNNSSEVKLVMEVAGWKMYWPQYAINSLITLDPGKSYFAYMNTAASVDFNVQSMKSLNGNESVLENKSPWNDVLHTPGNHVVAFNSKACTNFEIGDVIGAFTNNGLCAGMTNFEGTSAGLSINPDDLLTSQIDGFVPGEFINYKLFRPSTGEMFNLEVEYDAGLDDSGLFGSFSLSAITSLKMTSTGVSDMAGSGINIYPNPSHGIFNVNGISCEALISVYNAFGDQIQSRKVFNSTTLNLTNHQAGIYLIRIETLNGTYYQKLIVN